MDNPGHDLRPGMYTTVRLHVPVTRLDLLPADADTKRADAFSKGQVLAVPERAVIDTGSHKFVYRQAEQDTYEGVAVELGPRCGLYYPVIRGLRAGDHVVTTGSFLIDADTRLSAGTGSTYFGASAGPQGGRASATTTARPSMTRDDESKLKAVLAKLSPGDRALVASQGYCPMRGTRLGTMGLPVAVQIKGLKVFLCCEGCKDKALENPDQTLAEVDKLKANTAPRPK